MTALHSLLKRQLRRFADESIPLIEGQGDFIKAINEAYWQFDADRKMLEQSLELTSQELLERNAELKSINADLEHRVEERTAEFRASEARFRGLFEHVPVSIWEEDFSCVRQYIDNLRDSGVVDFSSYFAAHPEAVVDCAAQVKIIDVNSSTLALYQAESKQQLLADLLTVLGPDSLDSFKDELLALIRGDLVFGTEIVNYTLHKKRLDVIVRVTVAPGYEQTWSKVFVGISDITKRRQAETALAAERDLLQVLMDNVPDTIYFKDTSSRFTRINRAQVHVLGVETPEQAIGKTDLDFFQTPDLAQSFYEEEQRMIETGEPVINRIEFNPTPDGKPRWFSATKVPIMDDAGNVIGIVGISHDITERKQAEEALRQSEERFKLIAWATKDAVWDWHLPTNQIWWGEGLQKMFHYSAETAQSSAEWRLDHIHPEDRPKVNRIIDQALQEGMEFWSKEYRFQKQDGTYADIMDRGYIMHDDSGKPYRMIGAMMDITERKYMETSLIQANEQMGNFVKELQQRNHETILLNEMSHLLQACRSENEAYRIITDIANQLFPSTAGALYLINPARTLVSAIASWGHLPSNQRMFAPEDCSALRPEHDGPLKKENVAIPCLHLSEPLPAISYCVPMQIQGENLGMLHVQSASYENLSERQRQLAYMVVEHAGLALSNLKLREALREQSVRDPLTGLYNRRYMEEALKQQLSRATRQLHPMGIIMIDIDHFKRFNDTYGHAAGDALLRELGRFLQSYIRGEDIACRYGGEEFTLIMPDASLETVQQRAEELRKATSQLRLQGVTQFLEVITLSIGVAIYPEHGRTIEIVLRAADDALYRAKQEGRDRVITAEKAR
jgi:diguanylate cyclase (GGDEF)-like protein/PAS domain S-box-containing protein